MNSFLNHFFGLKDRRKNTGDRRRTDSRNDDRRTVLFNGDTTIITFSPYAFKDTETTQSVEQRIGEPQMVVQEKNYKIRLAHSKNSFNSASMLVQRMYLQKGYEIPGMQKMPDRITLSASQNGNMEGTITLGIDAGDGLLADENYKQEIDGLRAKGRKVCELTKFAVVQTRGSKRVLAGLFNVAYIFGRLMQKQTDVVIEVNPRHVNFYKRMLGFEEYGPERMCARVNAPSVLLRLELDYVDRQIERWGGKADEAKGEKSLYPYFFSKEDQEGIAQRLQYGI
jgi:hypothetical protein